MEYVGKFDLFYDHLVNFGIFFPFWYAVDTKKIWQPFLQAYCPWHKKGLNGLSNSVWVIILMRNDDNTKKDHYGQCQSLFFSTNNWRT
jgi:hypothetical protein